MAGVPIRDLRDYAVLAQQSYCSVEDLKLPEGWINIHHLRPSGQYDNLYSVCVHQRKKEVVLAIKGTDAKFNVLTSLGLLTSAITGREQIPPSQDLAEAIAENLSNLASGSVQGRGLDLIGRSIREMHDAVGVPVVDWCVSVLYACAIAVGLFLTGGLCSYSTVTAVLQSNVLTGTKLTFNSLRTVDEQVTERLKMVLPRGLQAADNMHAAIKSEYPGYTFKIVGHSLGAVAAELCAVRLGVECVTFDSPGSLQLMETALRYSDSVHDTTKVRITNYLSAPNIVNCLNGHVGESFRLFISHTDGFSLAHLAACSLGSTSRALSYATFGAWGFGVAVSKLAVCSAGGCVSGSVGTRLWRKYEWFKRQHRIESFVAYLSKSTVKMARVTSWPKGFARASFLGATIRQVLDLARTGFLPLQSDAPGIHNMTNEEGMREAGVARMPGYAIDTEFMFYNE